PLPEGAAGVESSPFPRTPMTCKGGVMQPRSKRIISLAAVVCAGAAFACSAATGDSSKVSAKDAKKTTAAAASLAPTSPVAVIGDKTITLQELDVQAAGALTRVRQEEYGARRQALDAMLSKEVP